MGEKGHFGKRVIALVGVAAAVAALVFLYWLIFLRGYVSTDDAAIDGNRIDISSKLLGRIVGLTVDEGDRVEKGRALVFLDSTELLTQKARAEAALELARQNIALSKINRDWAETEYQRARAQFRKGVIPLQKFQQAETVLKTSRAQQAIDIAQAAAAKAQLDYLSTQLSNTTVVAPRNGWVAKRWASVGDVVQPAQMIFTIYDLSEVWVSLNILEKKFHQVRLRDTAGVTVDAFPRLRLHGTVSMIGKAAASEFSLIPPNNATGNYTKISQRIPLKIALETVDGDSCRAPLLLPGMSAEVKIRIRKGGVRNER